LAKVFQVNVPALKLPALETVAAATTSEAGNERLAAAALPVAESALALEDFDTAEKIIKVADRAARMAKSLTRLNAVAALNATLTAMRAEYTKAKQASEVLASNPKDSEANLSLGKYQCFYKEDWEVGLPRLAQGSDAGLKALAEKTLKDPADPLVLAEIAGGWWDMAEKLPDKERAAIRRFSAERYRTALPLLTGLRKELAERRIAEGGKIRRYTLIPLIDTNKDVLHGTWRIDNNNQLRCESSHFVPRVQIPYRPPEEYDFVVTFSQPNLRNGINLIMPNKHGGSFFWTVSSENGTAYCLSINGSNNQTKLPASCVIQPNTVHTTVVQVRRDGVKGYLDGVLIRQHLTDFSDLKVDGWRETKEKSVLAIGCDEPTVFHAIHVIEITGTGGRTR
jgi:hypothetical protein